MGKTLGVHRGLARVLARDLEETGISCRPGESGSATRGRREDAADTWAQLSLREKERGGAELASCWAANWVEGGPRLGPRGKGEGQRGGRKDGPSGQKQVGGEIFLFFLFFQSHLKIM